MTISRNGLEIIGRMNCMFVLWKVWQFLAGIIVVFTTAGSEMDLRGSFNGQINMSSFVIYSLSKTNAVDLGSLPRRPTNLSLGLALVPPRFMMM